MKKLAIITAIVAANALFATSALAASIGTVTATGAITDTNCAASLDVTTVDMGVFNKADFAAVGDTQSHGGFLVKIEKCPVGVVSKALVTIKGTADGDDATAFANQAVSGAEGVAIQVTPNTGNVVSPNGLNTYMLTNGEFSALYNLAYVSTKPTASIKAGAVSVPLNVDVSYQ
ncbi:hypothetical protein C9426_33205 [Serratia sp. S1B]|nr:hypothetical protein C9426_33205 [Serratia sp. S1B]